MTRLRKLFAVSVFVVALLLSLSASSAQTAGHTWAGTWKSDFGQMMLDAGGSGSYAGFNPGTVTGTVTGNVDKGTWMQPGTPPKNGTFTFTMTADGQSFTGVWAYGADGSGGCGSSCGWSGTCIAGPCLANSTAVANVSIDLGYRIVAPGQELSSGHVAVGTTIELVAKTVPALPSGATIQIFDKPQGHTLAPKSGYLIRGCTGSPCTAERTERSRARTHAYRAFVVVGPVTTPGYKVIGKSNPVVVSWDEPRVAVELLVQTTNGGLFERSGKVPVGAQVTLRADTVGPLPPGTRIRITWQLQPGGFGGSVKICASSPCIGTKSYRLPANLTFRATVLRFGGNQELSQSKVVRVTWATR